MLYDTKKHELWLGVREKVDLTNKENKLLICLASGNVATYEEMSRYLYGVYNACTKNCVMVHSNRLIAKCKGQLKIKTVREVGYRLENEIFFE